MKKQFILFMTLVLCLSTAVACSASVVSTSLTAPSQVTPNPSGWTYQDNPGYPYVSFDAIWGTSSSDVFFYGIRLLQHQLLLKRKRLLSRATSTWYSSIG